MLRVGLSLSAVGTDYVPHMMYSAWPPVTESGLKKRLQREPREAWARGRDKVTLRKEEIT